MSAINICDDVEVVACLAWTELDQTLLFPIKQGPVFKFCFVIFTDRKSFGSLWGVEGWFPRSNPIAAVSGGWL